MSRKKKDFDAIESMTTIELHGPVSYVVRVWREEAEARDDYDNTDILKAVEDQHMDYMTPSAIAKAIGALDRVTAAEVKNLQGNGILIRSGRYQES